MKRPLRETYEKCIELRHENTKEHESFETLLWMIVCWELRELGFAVFDSFVKDGMLWDNKDLCEYVYILENHVSEEMNSGKVDKQRYKDLLNSLEHMLVYWA